MIRAAVTTLTYLKAWAPHPAAPDTHDLCSVILQAVHRAERSNSLEYQTYLRDKTLVVYDPPLRDQITRYMMSMTVLTQAECDKYFLKLHAACHLLVHKQALARLAPASRAVHTTLDYAHRYWVYYQALETHYAHMPSD